MAWLTVTVAKVGLKVDRSEGGFIWEAAWRTAELGEWNMKVVNTSSRKKSDGRCHERY